MPEYLAPGVFIEEIPARFKPIEGVSTSTLGVVGVAQKGTVPGFPPPFVAPVGFELPVDGGPVLVTSFGEFSRAFGGPLPQPQTGAPGFLARAVRAFFDNGGKRAYVTRVAHLDLAVPANSASRATLRLAQGTALRLARAAVATDTVLYLTSLRGLVGGVPGTLDIRRPDGTLIANRAIVGLNVLLNQVTLGAAVGAVLDPSAVFLLPTVGAALPAPAVTPPATPALAAGPMFHARNPGEWGNRLSIDVTNYDGPLVPILGAALATGVTLIPVTSTASLYRGAIIEVVAGPPATARQQYYEVTDILPGGVVQIAGPGLTVAVPAAATPPQSFVRVVGINISLTDSSGPVAITETFRGLTWNPTTAFPDAQRRHYATVLNRRSTLVYVQPPGIAGLAGGEAPTLVTQPCTSRGFPMLPSVLGRDGLANLTTNDIAGTDNGPGQRSGIASLADADDVRLIAAPGWTDPVVQNALISQAELLRYRFALLDGEDQPLTPVVSTILGHRGLYDSSYAAYYTPWIRVEESGQELFEPPTGYLAGICARVDNARGVWKAPANETVRGALGLRSYITTGEQEILNPRGVDVIRRFEGRGIRVWGGRTLSSDPEFRYVNVRRFLIFLEASLDRGTQWVVFEPNSPETWSRVTDSVSAFLNTQWRSGALFGRRPEDAYFVRCDETTMTADDVQNGRLICEIGVAIVRPAEFVIFRIEQITGFARQS